MRFTAAFGAMLALSAPVLAADYGVLRGSQTYDEPRLAPSAPFSWAGTYGGVHAGYSTVDFNATRQSVTLSADVLANTVVQPQAENLLRFGQTSDDRFGYGFFIGKNWVYEDIVYGVEFDYTRGKYTGTETVDINRSVDNLFGIATVTSVTQEATSTFTNIHMNGTTRNHIQDTALFKARLGYAMDRFMPYLTIGLAVARVQTDATVSYDYASFERVNNFTAIPTLDPITGAVTGFTRGAFTGQTTPALAGGAGAGTVTTRKTGYNAGLAIGGGIEWAVVDNLILRAEYQQIMMSEFKGVQTTMRTARIGAGMKF